MPSQLPLIRNQCVKLDLQRMVRDRLESTVIYIKLLTKNNRLKHVNSDHSSFDYGGLGLFSLKSRCN
jgi:hypothetical protein